MMHIRLSLQIIGVFGCGVGPIWTWELIGNEGPYWLGLLAILISTAALAVAHAPNETYRASKFHTIVGILCVAMFAIPIWMQLTWPD